MPPCTSFSALCSDSHFIYLQCRPESRIVLHLKSLQYVISSIHSYAYNTKNNLDGTENLQRATKIHIWLYFQTWLLPCWSLIISAVHLLYISIVERYHKTFIWDVRDPSSIQVWLKSSFFWCNPAHKATDKQTDDGEKLKVTLVVIVFLEINTICIIAFVAIYHYCNGRNII